MPLRPVEFLGSPVDFKHMVEDEHASFQFGFTETSSTRSEIGDCVAYREVL